MSELILKYIKFLIMHTRTSEIISENLESARALPIMKILNTLFQDVDVRKDLTYL